jgi:hypothetical protein
MRLVGTLRFAHPTIPRHCERSEAIQGRKQELDCFVAPLLAMTPFVYDGIVGD